MVPFMFYVKKRQTYSYREWVSFCLGLGMGESVVPTINGGGNFDD